MSWSVNYQGSKEEVIQRLNDHMSDATTSDQNSKQEYDDVKEHLIALVDKTAGDQNVNITASGHAYWEVGVARDRYATITVQAVR